MQVKLIDKDGNFFQNYHLGDYHHVQFIEVPEFTPDPIVAITEETELNSFLPGTPEYSARLKREISLRRFERKFDDPNVFKEKT